MTSRAESDFGVPLPGGVLASDRWTVPQLRDDGRPFDWGRCFGREAPRVLDLGCGDGRYLIGSSLARPDRDHLGIEWIEPMVVRAAQRAGRRGLTNVRFVAGDAVAWLSDRLVPDSVDEIHVYHPQPYDDPAVVRLGILSPAFFERAWIVCRRGGILVLQTDHSGYGKHLLEAARNHFDVEEIAGPWPDSPLGRTRREILARRKKLPILRMLARRRDEPRAHEPPRPWFDTPRRKRRVRNRP